MTALIPIVGIIGVFGSGAFIVWVIAESIQRSRQAKAAAEFHGKLLDRLGSMKDFSDFFNSEGGTRFLDSLALQKESTPQTRILRATSTGIVLTVVGVGLAMYSGELRDPYDHDFAYGVGFLSAVALSLGIGLLASAWGSMKLSRRLGLLEPPVPPQRPPSVL